MSHLCTKIISLSLALMLAVNTSWAEDGSSQTKGKILYYRNPMGLADTSPTPKKDAMGMDYIAVYAEETKNEAPSEAGSFSLSPQRIQKLGIRTEKAKQRTLAKTIRTIGLVQIDEAKQTIVAPRFEGWIGKLHVNTTGQQVKIGEPLFDFYSPELVQIETEFLTSGDTENTTDKPDGKTITPHNNPSLKRLWTFGVPPDEIERLWREKTVQDSITLRAPTNGTVTEKTAIEGMRFASGDALYKIIDRSNLWIIADIYEQDLAQIKTGQSATITIDALPHKRYEGTVNFIYPDIAKDTRTAKIRITIPNPDNQIRTNMLAHLTIKDTLTDQSLAVPSSAILDSGEKQIVFILKSGGHILPRQVETGNEVHGYTAILNGLKEGDEVITSATFLIDAESNIRAALQNMSQTENK